MLDTAHRPSYPSLPSTALQRRLLGSPSLLFVSLLLFLFSALLPTAEAQDDRSGQFLTFMNLTDTYTGQAWERKLRCSCRKPADYLQKCNLQQATFLLKDGSVNAALEQQLLGHIGPLEELRVAPVKELSFGCVEGGSDTEQAGTWGGDAGELLLALAVAEKVREAKLTGYQVKMVVRSYIARSKGPSVFFHTSTAAIAFLQDQLNYPELDITSPPAALQSDLIDLLASRPEAHGCTHFRSLVSQPQHYGLSTSLVGLFMREFFRIVWEGADPLRQRMRVEVMLPRPWEQGAKVKVSPAAGGASATEGKGSSSSSSATSNTLQSNALEESAEWEEDGAAALAQTLLPSSRFTAVLHSAGLPLSVGTTAAVETAAAAAAGATAGAGQFSLARAARRGAVNGTDLPMLQARLTAQQTGSVLGGGTGSSAVSPSQPQAGSGGKKPVALLLDVESAGNCWAAASEGGTRKAALLRSSPLQVPLKTKATARRKGTAVAAAAAAGAAPALPPLPFYRLFLVHEQAVGLLRNSTAGLLATALGMEGGEAREQLAAMGKQWRALTEVATGLIPPGDDEKQQAVAAAAATASLAASRDGATDAQAAAASGRLVSEPVTRARLLLT